MSLKYIPAVLFLSGENAPMLWQVLAEALHSRRSGLSMSHEKQADKTDNTS